jgi:DNA-binding MarR family transcriptional regulator
METLTGKIKEQIAQVINTIVFKEKKQVFKFKGVTLYPSEIHLLLMIENEIDTNATQIAKQLGLTKGAVSQTLSRLEKKGIIVKTKDPYNKNELTLNLTDSGKKAYELCQSIQSSFLAAQDDYLEKLNSKEKGVVLNFLIHLGKTMDDLDPS